MLDKLLANPSSSLSILIVLKQSQPQDHPELQRQGFPWATNCELLKPSLELGQLCNFSAVNAQQQLQRILSLTAQLSTVGASFQISAEQAALASVVLPNT